MGYSLEPVSSCPKNAEVVVRLDLVLCASFNQRPFAGQKLTRARWHRLVRERFACEPRGSVEVKGKGGMDVWRVIGPT